VVLGRPVAQVKALLEGAEHFSPVLNISNADALKIRVSGVQFRPWPSRCHFTL
jgi:hypothetical protein